MYFEGYDAAEAARRSSTTRTFVPLSRLDVTFSRFGAAEAAAAYEESAIAARTLVERLGLKTIGRMLQTLDSGASLTEAIETQGVTMTEFEAIVAQRIRAR
jgi:hypothetical protein